MSSPNLYSYTSGNPIQLTDPEGLQPFYIPSSPQEFDALQMQAYQARTREAVQQATDAAGLAMWLATPHRPRSLGCVGPVCVSSASGDPEAQVSLSLSLLAGAFQLCSSSDVFPRSSFSHPGCEFYDPQQDNEIGGTISKSISLSAKANVKVGVVGFAINPDGSYCIQAGLMMAFPIGPVYVLGGVSE